MSGNVFLFGQCREARYESIRVELAVTLTYCQMAATTQDFARKNALLARAEQAYAVAGKLIERGISKDFAEEVRSRQLKINAGLLSTRTSPIT